MMYTRDEILKEVENRITFGLEMLKIESEQYFDLLNKIIE